LAATRITVRNRESRHIDTNYLIMVTYYYRNRLARRAPRDASSAAPPDAASGGGTPHVRYRRGGIVTSLTSRYLPLILAEIPFPAAHRPDIDWRESRMAASAGPAQTSSREAAQP
jgi:hypothetical protein